MTAETSAVLRCDDKHPFNGHWCIRPRWHKGNHLSASEITWGFRGTHIDDPGVQCPHCSRVQPPGHHCERCGEVLPARNDGQGASDEA